MMFLSGDRNITNGVPVKNGILELTTNRPPGWTSEIHGNHGHVLFVDGHVETLNTPLLLYALHAAGVATNRLALP